MDRPYKVIDMTGVAVFDGFEAVTWKVLMRNSASANDVRVKNISPGQLYTFLFEQDGKGGHSFAWPPTVKNGMRINPEPFSVSRQNFIGSTGGVLLANIPGAWGNQ
jgi:hypothetical protein